MARYQVILAYDGAEFYGFQRQAGSSGQRTVQGVVEDALRRIGWQGRAILFAGRTDVGVHASGQVIAFDLDWSHSMEALLAALNANLPTDVAAQAAQPVADDFHPRYDARARRYQYRLFCQPRRNPLRERYAWRVWPGVDGERMQRAATYLIGTHDFAAFGSPPRRKGITLRTVYQAQWSPELSDGWIFEVSANAFLFHMVRRMVGMLAAIGQGKQEPEDVVNYLQNPNGAKLRTLAPAHGLTLVEVIY